MATTVSQEKKSGEQIKLSADFSSALLTGETLSSGNISTSCRNAVTGANAPSILFGAPTLSGNFVSQIVTGGTDGDIYTLTSSSGTTNLGLNYETELNLIIADTPAAETPLCTRDEIKRELRIADNSDDQLLDDLNLAASSYLRKRTGRDFTFTNYVEIIQPLAALNENLVRLKLRHYPVHTVSRIRILFFDGSVLFDYTDPTQFDFVPEGYVWFTTPYNVASFNNYFYPYPDKNEITYTAGFPSIPQDVREAAKHLVILMYRNIGTEGLASEQIGDYNYKAERIASKAETSDPFLEGIVKRYQRIELTLIG